MIGSIFRVLLGFVVACVLAGLTKVMFALTPGAILAASDEQMSRTLEWVLLTATHSAVFAAPFALVAAAIGEWQSIRSWTYYALAGILIALAGFLAQYQGEIGGQPSVANNYAVTAYLTTGFVAGFVYWMLSGRVAGDDDEMFSVPAGSAPASPPVSALPKPVAAAPPPPAPAPKTQSTMPSPVSGPKTPTIPPPPGPRAPTTVPSVAGEKPDVASPPVKKD